MAIPLMLPLPLLYTFSTFSPPHFFLSLFLAPSFTPFVSPFFRGTWFFKGTERRITTPRAGECNNRSSRIKVIFFFFLSLGMGNSIAIDGRSFFSNSLLSLFFAFFFLSLSFSLVNERVNDVPVSWQNEFSRGLDFSRDFLISRFLF